VLYDAPVEEIITPAGVMPFSSIGDRVLETPVAVDALWDTGATATCIKPELCDRLKLPVVDEGATLSGIGGVAPALRALVTIQLSHNMEIEGCPVYIIDFPGDAGILIGMDVKYPRQSRGLDFVNRSKRLVLEPPKGGFHC
jgi:hypothetical protein